MPVFVTQQLIVPPNLRTLHRSLKMGGNKFPAKVFDSNVLFFFCLQVGESTMGNKDGFRLERTCAGAKVKWRVSR
jgi:hypothetical protein